MILINVKFRVKEEYADQWPDISWEFTQATLEEPGNLWFEWSRSVLDPQTYVLIEAFEEGEAPTAHVNSEHFQRMQKSFPQYLEETPLIVSTRTDASGWGPMSEITVE